MSTLDDLSSFILSPIASNTDPTKGAALVGYEGSTVKAALDSLNSQLNKARTVTVVAATTVGQSVFPIPGGYPINLIDVDFVGGHLINGIDYTATDGANIVLAAGLAAQVQVGNNLSVEAFGSFNALIGYGSETVKQALDSLNPSNLTPIASMLGTESWSILQSGSYVKATSSALALFSQQNQVWALSTATGAVSRTAAARFSDQLSVLEYCVGTGQVDDTRNLINAEAAAFVTGKALWFPYGTIVNFNGVFTCRVPIWGYGATLQQTNSTITQSGTVTINNANNVLVMGLTINGNGTFRGLVTNSCTGIKVIDATAQNCVGMGFGHYLPTNLHHARTQSLTIGYGFSTIPTSGGSADGIYIAGGTNCYAEECYAYDFCRIGFVSEGSGSTKGTNIFFVRCHSSYAHNNSDSSTEFNAAAWMENTNSGGMIDCTGDNISSGVSQTSSRTWGFVIGIGQTAYGTIDIRSCKVRNNAVTLSVGISVLPTGNFTTVNVRDVYVENAQTGISSLGGPAALIIDNPTFVNMSYTAGGTGGIVLNAQNALPLLDISRVNTTSSSNTYSTGTGDINIFAAPTAGGVFNLRDCRSTSLVCVHHQHVWTQANVTNCSITHNDPTYPAFVATLFNERNMDVTLGATSTGYINNVPGLSNGTWIKRDGSVTAASLISTQLSGASYNLDWTGATFTNVAYSFSTTGTYLHKFLSCIFGGFGSQGAIYWGFGSYPGSNLIIQGCEFNAPNVAYTPIQMWNHPPGWGIVDYSNYTNATVLTTLTNVAPNPTFGTVTLGSGGALYSDAANVLNMRNGTNGQTFYTYGTYTDASNWERSVFATSGGLTIGTQQSGTGVARPIYFQTGYTNRWQMQSAGGFVPLTNATYSIGGSGAAIANLWMQGILVNQGTVYAQPLTGTTVTVANSTNCEVIDPAGTLAALTVQFPTPLADGHKFELVITQPITALTLTGGTLVGGVTTTAGYYSSAWRYRAANTTWYRTGN
jgi:hypothetical protein